MTIKKTLEQELTKKDPQQPAPIKNSLFSSKGKENYGKVTVKYDVGFSNALYIRGNGANLSWEKGTQLKNTKPDEWIWEPTTPFNNCEFKILINDKKYEEGENHHLHSGSNIQINPKF